MGPNQKALLVELDKRFAAQEKRFDGLERKLDSTTASSSTRLDALESAAKVFDEWRPGVDGVINDLRIEVNKLATLKLEVGKISKYMERSMVDGPSATPGVFATAPVTKSASAPASPCASIHDTNPVVTPNLSPPASATSRLPCAHLRDLQPLGPTGTASKSGTGKVNSEWSPL
ncbi:unnamed protein product [Miscanthus lutarioriparius]|uniref:Uncharacterized protein n=1 Tax=Miscanthus lutarioriparius TaxID=422564 RepID=A0A811R032_9POAL|nr:unnamed protein product [Miscanthus lutarioriparius]